MKRVLYSLLLVLAVVTGVAAQSLPQQVPPATPSSSQDLLNQIRIDQKLDAQVPLDLMFRDETGREVPLRTYFGDRPVVLAPVYFECPMMCTLILNGLINSLRELQFSAGKEFDVIAVSIDPREKPELAMVKKKAYAKRYGRANEAGWHFLTGEQANIEKLTDAVGFRYVWDAKTQQYAHSSGIMVLTPEGKVSKYFYGVDYPAKDLRLGLVEASNNRIGTPVDQIKLLCFHYDPATGKYTPIALNMIKLGGVATLVGLGILFFFLFRGERQRKLREGLG